MYNKKISNFIPLLSLLFLILGLIPISSTFAQTPTEQIIKNTLQPLNSEKSGLFVLQFSTTGMTESAARAYTNIVAQNINNTNRFNVTYLEEAEELIQKSAPELLPCFEIGCGIQIGKILKAKWVITGHISLTEVGSFVLTVKLVNIFDNSLVFEETMRFTDTNMDRRMYLLSTRIARNVPLIGLIIEANNKIAIISLGEQDGISVDDQLIIYRNDIIRTASTTGLPKAHERRKNIGILRITQVGEKISEGVYFQSIEIPKTDHIVTTFLDKRRQIATVDEVRRELDTHERNVYEITERVELSPIQLIDQEKTKWLSKVRILEENQEYWQYFLIGSGVSTAYLLKEFEEGDDWRMMAAAGTLAYSTYQFIRTRNELNKLENEGRYKGYIELKINPEMDGVGLNYRFSF
ncbi:MAG: hypothetical protein HOC24_14315 [Deltaproteobacteria bacterium]|nr:hypothetical protein [Deltaproteobacteria bacterium]